ncbi:hypothetical protein F5Y13DRAFT_156728 [Hypoxylon sp. FL1857]|nr:hypothetical protein F5Y13DRAFT_156728 [Hypoxylon sp. FL1857]
MESLRKQLGETQEALHEKIVQVRQLRASQSATSNSWTQEKQDLEARLQRLEAELQQLRYAKEDAVGSGAKTSQTHGDGKKNGTSSLTSMLMDEGVVMATAGDEDTVVITRSRMRDVEAKFKNVTDELAEKTKMCETLQRQLQAQGSNRARIPHLPEITDELVVAHWEKLRGQIRSLSLARFNATVQPKLVPERARREFDQLSTHWKSYLTGNKLTCYIFRALIWRYLQTCVFAKTWHLWGKGRGDAAEKLAGLFSSKAPGAEFQEWRTRTAQLLHKTSKTDLALVEDAADKIMKATSPFATGDDEEELKKAILDIVAAAVDLSTIFACSHYSPLMSDKPGSDLTRGFPYQEATMDVRGKLGVQSMVDLMVSPSLLKKEADYSVLVKAEVIC